MNFTLDKVRMPLWVIKAVLLIILIVCLGVWYYHLDPGRAKEVSIVAGLVAGLTVYLATFLTLLRPLQELDRYHRTGIKGLLSNRHDKNYYRDLVANSRRCVDVLGSSCGRFVQDFLDIDSDDKVLIDALNKHPQLKIRILIPTEEHMSSDGRSRTGTMLRQLGLVIKMYGSRVEIRRFGDRARHSFVLADNDLVAGPVFDDDRSRHAPAVHVSAESAFGQKYSLYFNELWSSINDIV